jgi:transcriptional regulator with AAA-type ATPase domain
MPRGTLDPSDRAFLERVARAVFTNPFGDGWEELDVAAVRERMAALGRAGRADLSRYAGAERETLEYALLFDAYYACAASFDALIDEELASDAGPPRVGFAPEVLDGLRARGFTRERARFLFALFFQLRRAFFFLSRSLVGGGAGMRALRRDLWDNIFTRDLRRYGEHLWSRMEDFSTLLLGETGTGKGTAAAAIGRSGFIPLDAGGERFAASFVRAFVPVHLAQLPEPLIESELFGHKKGAFTGAVEHHDGVFATCSPHGSIFLDEIGDASAAVQVKLLRVLQERTFSPVGSRETRRFRGRVIAATNRSLDELRRPGGLRDDLFYRLCSDVIEMPPLRRRLREAPSELDDLVASVMRRLLGADAPELARLVRATLADAPGPRYPWPGNVRELEQAIRRVLLKGSYAGDRPRAEESPDAGALAERITAGAMDARDVLAAYCAHLYERHGTYEEVARIARLDRRTVRKHVERARGARA